MSSSALRGLVLKSAMPCLSSSDLEATGMRDCCMDYCGGSFGMMVASSPMPDSWSMCEATGMRQCRVDYCGGGFGVMMSSSPMPDFSAIHEAVAYRHRHSADWL